MLSTASGVAQSFLRPSFEITVEETRATSTGRSSTVASRARTVKVQTAVTETTRSRGD